MTTSNQIAKVSPNRAPTDYRFADDTTVPAHQTVAEIREWLERFGASSFIDYTDAERGFAVFGWQGKMGAFMVYLPLPDPKKFSTNDAPKRGRAGDKSNIHRSAYEQERARLLRVVFHLVKMKLIAVTENVTTLEKEFFADLVVWNAQGKQQTVYEWYAPQIEHLRAEGLQPPVLPAIENPRLLPGGPGTRALPAKGDGSK